MPEQTAVSKSLSEVLNRAIDISAFKEQSYQKWYFDEHRMLRDVRIDFPRVCQICFDEDPHMDWRWGLGTVARCDKHNALLLDSCPNCHEKYQWHTSLIKGCSNCGLAWQQLAEETKLSIPAMSPIEKMLLPDESGQIAATDSDIRNICRSLVRAARPYDILQESLQRIPFSHMHSELLLNALERIESPWTHSIVTERNEYIRPFRRKLCLDNDTQQYRFHIGYRELANHLSITTTDLRVATKANAFPRLNPRVTNVRDQIFDLRVVNKILHKFEGHLTMANAKSVTLSPRSKALTQGSISYGHVLTSVLNQELVGYFPMEGNYSLITVKVEDLDSWLKDQT
ncbi:hypothetical protein [Amphritea pacifica]|uniref:hypothetical protein n=1 Tax=Amphritea pacifica TaxID=2811233 RepID=UPI001962AA1B|nr:hypothetical protein [Amphritea pacifica]MBN1005680.1 hypothetical protein [Amphritea pacifica]